MRSSAVRRWPWPIVVVNFYNPKTSHLTSHLTRFNKSFFGIFDSSGLSSKVSTGCWKILRDALSSSIDLSSLNLSLSSERQSFILNTSILLRYFHDLKRYRFEFAALEHPYKDHLSEFIRSHLLLCYLPHCHCCRFRKQRS